MPHCIHKSWLSYAMHICIHRLKISTMMKSQMHLVETWKHHNLFEFNIQWKTTATSSTCRQTASHTQFCHQLHPPDCHQTASLASLSPNQCTHWFVMGPPHLPDHHLFTHVFHQTASEQLDHIKQGSCQAHMQSYFCRGFCSSFKSYERK